MNLNDNVFVVLTEHGKVILNNDPISFDKFTKKEESGMMKEEYSRPNYGF